MEEGGKCRNVVVGHRELPAPYRNIIKYINLLSEFLLLKAANLPFIRLEEPLIPWSTSNLALLVDY